jgi:hypothetical protein
MALFHLQKLYSVEYNGKIIKNGERIRLLKEVVMTCL